MWMACASGLVDGAASLKDAGIPTGVALGGSREADAAVEMLMVVPPDEGITLRP